MLNAGKLDTQVTVLEPLRDDTSETSTWTTYTTIWAQVKPLRGLTAFIAAQQQTSISLQLLIRPRADIVETMRLQFGGHTYQIDGILPISRDTTQIDASEIRL
jgi:SPP1 family predicted phage head-tail adaptor